MPFKDFIDRIPTINLLHYNVYHLDSVLNYSVLESFVKINYPIPQIYKLNVTENN